MTRPSLIEMAAQGAARLGNSGLESMIREALAPNPDWEALEHEWDQGAACDIESFIEAHASDFFVGD